LCKDATITGNRSYIESPNFGKMYTYKPKEICSCKAELASPHYIKVSFTDKSFNTSMAHVKIQWDNTTEYVDSETSVTKSRRLNKPAKEGFQIVFEAGQEAGGGFFRLRYEADQPITLVCNPGTGGGLSKYSHWAHHAELPAVFLFLNNGRLLKT
jgi:hypothetical protein